MITFREFLLTENAEAKNAYDHGKKDATAGREKKNASDFYGPYGGDYYSGYDSVTQKNKADDKK